MASTNVPIGSPLARKLYSVALFASTQRLPSFRRNLTGPSPKQPDAERKLKGQTSPDFPFVRVTDLSKTAGDTVSVDLFNIIQGKPVMGDEKLSGKMMNLTFDSMDIRIDQYRGGVDPGGRMTQQRTLHRLRGVAQANLSGWNNRLEDQTCMVHVAGQRGYDDAADWVVPLESDPDFNKIVVNDVEPPTYNRHFRAGGAASVANLDTDDFLSLEDIDRLRAELDEMVFPLQPIRIPEDPSGDENPLFCLYMTSRQWHWLQTNTGEGNWRTFLQNAWQRSTGWDHPLFRGTPGMWNGILVKKMSRAIRFPQGEIIKERNADNVVQEVPAAVHTDRAILLGAQALSEVYGRHGQSGYYTNWYEEVTDHGNTVEISTAFMGGKKKLRFMVQQNELTDHGVMVIDSYAPPVNA